MSVIAFVTGAIVAAAASIQSVSRAVQLQQDIVRRGLSAQARIVRIWRPPLFGAFTRIYFEFQPEGGRSPVRACHVDRRSADDLLASLPAVGSRVNIRYLADNPSRAVIARLVSRFSR